MCWAPGLEHSPAQPLPSYGHTGVCPHVLAIFGVGVWGLGTTTRRKTFPKCVCHAPPGLLDGGTRVVYTLKQLPRGSVPFEGPQLKDSLGLAWWKKRGPHWNSQT